MTVSAPGSSSIAMGSSFAGFLQRELPQLKWASLFRALRMLELGGEVVAGHFVTGVVGLQFASHQTIRRLREGLGEDRIWWVNAVDPASPCALGLELPTWPLPRRVPGNHLVFHGRRSRCGLRAARRRTDDSSGPGSSRSSVLSRVHGRVVDSHRSTGETDRSRDRSTANRRVRAGIAPSSESSST